MAVLQPLSGPTEAPQQYKQPSRKGKKAWRKHVDVSEVEKGLDELNKEIIKGGVIAEQKSEELFTVDVVGEPTIAKKFPKHTQKVLKADQIIAERSAVPAVSVRKRPGDEKTTDGVLPAKRPRTAYVTHKELTRLRKVADGNHDHTVEVTDATYDVWSAPPPAEAARSRKSLEEFEFVPKPVETKVPKTLQQQPVSLVAAKKPVPAVLKPNGGYSYNPSFPDYEARLAAEGAKAVEAERKRLAAAEAERRKKEAAARSAAEAEAAEARADLSEWDEDSAWEGCESGGEELALRAKRPQRKTQAQRNRIKRRKEEEQRRKQEAALKRKRMQQEKLKEITREVEERERRRQLAKRETSGGSSDDDGDDGDVDDTKLRRKPLGKGKLPEKDLELVLPDELEDSLRRLRPEGNLLKDRYRSLLVRGKLESRRKIPFRKQAKTKVTQKWTYKDFHID